MRPRTWGRLLFGTLVIGGVLTGLWAIYHPSVGHRPLVRPAPPPRLRQARAVVLLRPAGASRARRAGIACDGARREASGFWAAAPKTGCAALAATRGALLSGPGCRRLDPARTRLVVSGAFGARRFEHRSQRGGCPDPDGWIAVDVLGVPVLEPDREISDARVP
jgi:hypothetical protein